MEPAPTMPPAAPAPMPVPPPSKGIGKIVISIVVLLALLAAAYYFYAQMAWPQIQPAATPTPTPSATESETAGWETYSNTQYGFEMKYPQNLVVEEIPSPFGMPGIKFSDEQNNSVIAINSYRPTVDPSTFYLYSGSNYSHTGEATIGGLTALKFQSPTDTGYVTTNKRIRIDVKHTGTPNVNQQTLDKILSTFTFTNAAGQTDMSEWKTYRNEKYGFAFDHPSAYVIDGNTSVAEQGRFRGLKASDASGRFSFRVRIVNGITNYKWIGINKECVFDKQQKVFTCKYLPEPIKPWDTSRDGSEIYFLSDGDAGAYIENYHIPDYQNNRWILIERTGGENTGTPSGNAPIDVTALQETFKSIIKSLRFTR